MKTTFFPFSLVRYASLDHHLLDSWIFQSEQQDEKHIIHLRQQLCDELYQQVSLVTSDKDRKVLLSFKRLIFNAKPLSPIQVGQIQIIAPVPTLLPYYHALLDHNNRQRTHEQQFDTFLDHCRQHLQEIAQNELLQNGLILSSPLLFEQLPAYIQKPPSQHKHKEAKLEFSLLRYVTRMCFKTSPFSTFTYTGTMLLHDQASIPTTREINSHLKLNNHLFGYLLNILKWHPLLNEHLYISINTTAVEEAGKIKFLINYSNIESFQQINTSTILQLIPYYIHPKTTLHELISSLSTLTGITDSNEIKQYLLQLCATGYLELSTGISAIEENWSEALITFLQPIDEAIEIIRMLQHLHTCKQQYEQMSPTTRFNTLQQAASVVNTTLLQLEQQAIFPTHKPDQQNFQATYFLHQEFSARKIFYEDCYTTVPETLPATDVTPIIHKLEQLLSRLSPADPKRTEREHMLNFFLKHYTPQAQIPLTTFYHDYYQHVKKQGKPTQQEEDPWITRLRQTLSSTEYTIRLTADDFPPATDNTQQSRAAFIQFFKDPITQESAAVINSLLPGLGKVNGRFLSLFPADQTRAFNDYNDQLYPNHIKAEISDGSIFNANCHPPLLPYQVVLPGGNSAFPEANRIPVSNISVKLDLDTNTLALATNGQPLYAFDLCLEAISGRSNLYQLLSHFNPDNRPSLRIIFKLIDELHPPANDINIYPRITFEDTIVLRRRTWEIRTASIPTPQPAETNYHYYYRLHTWRTQHDLPPYTFLFLRKRHKKQKAGLNDDYKPQFIHFQQPLLIELWKKLLQRAGEYIYLEEVLPDPYTPGTTVKEHLLQWYKY